MQRDPLRVLQFSKFYPPDPGGIETVAFELTEGLHRAGVAVEVLCVHRGPGAREDRAVSGYRVLRLPARWSLASMPLSLSMLWRAGSTLRACDLVHLHMPNPLAALAIWLWRPGAKVVLHWHSDVVRQRRTLRLYEPLQRWILRRADAVIATSQAYALASQPLQTAADKVHVIPIGIRDPAVGIDGQRLARLPACAAGRRVVLATGRMTYYKGFDVLIRAACRLAADVEVRIVGDGELLAECRALAASLGVAERVRFLGRLDDEALRRQYAAADVFCLPSTHRSEAYGVVMLEAMAFGKPVVSTRIPGSGVDWVNQQGVTGLCVPVGDDVGLAQALSSVLDNRALALRFGAAARQRFEDCFTADNMSRLTLDLYQALLRR